MRIQLLSDVHLEFHRDDGRAFVDSLDPTGIDVLMLAGDIAVGSGIAAALALICSRFRDARVLYVHGNHEFYNTDRASVIQQTRRAHPNLTWLDCSIAEIEDWRFLGAPLWFKNQEVDPRLKLAMTDFSVIRDFESWVYEENARAIAFLERELRQGDVVMTHHLPSQRSVSSRFADHPLNPFFVCDLEQLILERRPRLWMHGHTHDSMRYELADTTVLCNPFGYAGIELNAAFEDCLTTDL